MTDPTAALPPTDMTAVHDPDPEACAGEPVDYDWAADPDAEGVTDARPDADSVAGEAA